MIHQNIKSIAVAALFSAFSLMSCNEKDFLNEVNPNTITDATFWQTSAQFNSALTTVYGATQFQSISGGGLVNEMIMADEGGTESWYRPFAFRNFTYTDATDQVSDKWNELYVGIFRANQVIEHIQKADASVFTAGVKEKIEGQARFLRAFFYFQVANTYGKGVITTSVDITTLNKPLSTLDEINSKVIIPDLEFAAANLPEKWTTNDVGRVTAGSANALLGKVYLYKKDYAKAAPLFLKVINSGVYQLVPNIMDNFTHQNEFNAESIFEVAFNADINPGANGGSIDDNAYRTGSEATNIATAFGQLNFGAYNTLLPTYFVHELFTNDEIDPTNPINNGNQQSKRMTASIVPSNGEGLYYGLKIGAKAGWGFGQTSYIKKFTNWYHLPNEDGNSRSGINFRHIRLADVYLMYAECLVSSGGSVDEAIKYIDFIRTRAGVKTLQQYMAANGGKFPQLHISKQVYGTQPLADKTAANVLTHIQRVERPLELCFEGHRWKDLVRWGIVKKVFTELLAEETWRIANPNLFIDKPLYSKEKRIRDDFKVAAASYKSEAHDYFPIPASELQTNNLAK